MMPEFLLAEVIKFPQCLSELRLGDWDILIRQARYSGLLAKLHQLAQECEIPEEISEKVTPHLLSAQIVVDKQSDGLRCEQVMLSRAFTELDAPLLFLKGAAYFFMDLPFAKSRMLSDLDLLVPKSALTKVEGVLSRHGWTAQPKDKYDEHYYREWMHEIPPVSHYKRRSVLDIHHTILPPTTQYNPDPEKIMAAAREISPGLWALCPEDLVIHSATHLFHDGELEHGMRDLVDIHELLTYFSEHEPGFWDRLIPRAIELDLLRPLYYGLHYAHEMLDSPIPEQVLEEMEQGAPNKLMGPVMDWLFLRALRPKHPSSDLPGTELARFLLYVRSHYLRMPLYLLIPHLTRKAWKRQFDKAEPAQA